jgi:hypothetical protein
MLNAIEVLGYARLRAFALTTSARTSVAGLAETVEVLGSRAVIDRRSTTNVAGQLFQPPFALRLGARFQA